MPTTYSPNLGLELPGDHEQTGFWGQTTNRNLGTLLEQAISGFVSVPISNSSDTTITMPDGASGVARNMYLLLTGSLSATRNLIVPSKPKLYFVWNTTAYPVRVKTASGVGTAVEAGERTIFICDGSDVFGAVNFARTTAANSFVGTQTVNGSLVVNGPSTVSGQSVVVNNDPRLADARTPTAHGHTYSDISGTPPAPTLPSNVAYKDANNSFTVAQTMLGGAMMYGGSGIAGKVVVQTADPTAGQHPDGTIVLVREV